MRSVLSTLYFPRRALWTSRVDMLDRGAMSAQRLLTELLRKASTYDVVVLDGAVGLSGGFVDRMAAVGIVRRRDGPLVVITDATWGAGDGPLAHTVRRGLLRTFDSARTTYCVLSTYEQATFPGMWGVDPARVAFTPFYWTLPMETPPLLSGNGGVFAGGDSLRDHATVLAAAHELPALSLTLATRWRPDVPIPHWVRFGAVDPAQFTALMGDNSVVVVALRPGLSRSAGQQTYLNAMALGKIVIVTDSPGVHDHIDHGRTGLVVPPGDPSALAVALRWATDPGNAVATAALGRHARDDALSRFSPDAYIKRLLQVIDNAAV